MGVGESLTQRRHWPDGRPAPGLGRQSAKRAADPDPLRRQQCLHLPRNLLAAAAPPSSCPVSPQHSLLIACLSLLAACQAQDDMQRKAQSEQNLDEIFWRGPPRLLVCIVDGNGAVTMHGGHQPTELSRAHGDGVHQRSPLDWLKRTRMRAIQCGRKWLREKKQQPAACPSDGQSLQRMRTGCVCCLHDE